jgi:YgiT-type zinc finger domain-containing protein
VSRCPVCRSGELHDADVETWMKKAGQWVLLTHVPARKCDTCGETTFSQKVAERLADIVDLSSATEPTGSRWFAEYNLDQLGNERPTGESPKAGTVSKV